jgi:transaldolase
MRLEHFTISAKAFGSTFARFAAANIDVQSLSVKLQDEGAKSFVNSWNDLMAVIESKCAMLERAS